MYDTLYYIIIYEVSDNDHDIYINFNDHDVHN